MSCRAVQQYSSTAVHQYIKAAQTVQPAVRHLVHSWPMQSGMQARNAAQKEGAAAAAAAPPAAAARPQSAPHPTRSCSAHPAPGAAARCAAPLPACVSTPRAAPGWEAGGGGRQCVVRQVRQHVASSPHSSSPRSTAAAAYDDAQARPGQASSKLPPSQATSLTGVGVARASGWVTGSDCMPPASEIRLGRYLRRSLGYMCSPTGHTV